LAIRTASSTSSYGITERTGPKISSCAIRMPLSTSAKTVGRTYQPEDSPSGMPLPPSATRAPSSWPSAMYFSTRSCWRCATRGPISVTGSDGSPTGIEATVSTRASTTAS
jgi:hypothetical protein